jgi:DNA-binding response OmpR family regulator
MTTSAGVLAVIDARPEPGGRLESDLLSAGLTVEWHSDEIRAVARLAARRAEAVVLCVRRPSDALGAVVRTLREELHLPVLLAWDPQLLEAATPAILAGALPVLSVPLHAAEVLDRLQEVWPSRPPTDAVVRVGELTIDAQVYDVHLGDRPLHLTKGEVTLLAELARHAGHVVSHDHFHALWPTSADPDRPLVKAIARLRHTLADVGAPGAIETIRGIGYRLDERPFLPDRSEAHPD